MSEIRKIHSVHKIEPSKGLIDLPSNSIIENDNLNYDPFLLVEHIGPIHFHCGEAFGAVDHPHSGLQVILYMIEGSVLHDDSFTSSSKGPTEITAGSLLYISTGSGIVHYEMPPQPSIDTESQLECFQIWVNSPKEEKSSIPNLKHFLPDDIPIVRTEDNSAEIRVIAGSVFGVSGILEINPTIIFLDIILKKGYSDTLKINIFNEQIEMALVYVFSPIDEFMGEPILKLCDEQLKVGQVGVFTDNGESIEFKILRNIPCCRLLIIGGKPLKEQVVPEGPFAMCKRSEITEAYADFHSGKYGTIAGADERKILNEDAMRKYRQRVSLLRSASQSNDVAYFYTNE